MHGIKYFAGKMLKHTILFLVPIFMRIAPGFIRVANGKQHTINSLSPGDLFEASVGFNEIED